LQTLAEVCCEKIFLFRDFWFRGYSKKGLIKMVIFFLNSMSSRDFSIKEMELGLGLSAKRRVLRANFKVKLFGTII
jgi:hypothetical protein